MFGMRAEPYGSFRLDVEIKPRILKNLYRIQNCVKIGPQIRGRPTHKKDIIL